VRRLERRLECLEDARRQEEARLGRKALEYLSDEDLDALEDALEAGQEDGSATFEDLYRASSEQTRRVFRALADGSAEEPDRGRWHALQVWLEGGEHRVTIPYAEALAEKMGDVVVRLRRDFSVVLSLIKAHAILHQATRERDADGRIVATLGDYSRVRDLVSGLIAEGVEATVPKTVRETVEDVENVIDGWGEEHATNKAVAEELEIDKAAASRRVRTAIGRGYIKNLEDRKGHPAQLVLAEDMPEDQEILPAPEELEGVDPLTVDRGGIYYPPSPLGDPRRGRGVLYPSAKLVNRSTPARGVRAVSALKLYHNLQARGVILEACESGEHLKVNAPAGELTEADRRALFEFKPTLLKFLSRTPEREPQRKSEARWPGSGLIRILDPFTGEWHEWPAARCLPGVVAEADRRRKGGADGSKH